MSLKALYLGSGQKLQVRADGPALRVDGSGRTPGRYPLSRLARVISAEDVAWSTRGLVSCLKSGVPVVFVGSDGVPSGWCFGPRRRETTLAQLLREGLSHSEWDSKFSDWRRNVEINQAAAALRNCGLAAIPTTILAAEVSLFNHHRRRCGTGVAAHMCALKGAASALIARRVEIAVGDPELIGFPRPGLHFTQIFGEMMRWQLHGLIKRTHVATLRAPAEMRTAAILVERDSALLDAAASEMLTAFEMWLRDWLL